MFAKANNDQKFMFISGGNPTKYYFLGHYWSFMVITVIDKAVVDRALRIVT